MTALADIKKAVAEAQTDHLRRSGRTLRGFKIRVGNSAERSILAETGGPLPFYIESVPVERTTEFPGWSLEPAT